jgi:predicted phage terminase large subunit-like protein
MAINQALIDVARGKIKRLIISVPPRHGKSWLCGRFFTHWYLGMFPDKRIIYATHNDTLAGAVGGFVRDDFDQWGEKLFGLRLNQSSSAKNWWHIAGHGEGGFQAGGIHSLGGGIGADVLMIDDPIKGSFQSGSGVERDNVWTWYQSFSNQRLQPGGSIVVIATRWSSDDLIGRILESQQGWSELKFPAEAEDDDPLGREPGEWLFPEFKPPEEYEQAKRDIIPFFWAAQYQQRPGLVADAEFPAHYFDYDGFWFNEWPGDIQLTCLSLDPSQGKTDKSDYSAYVFAGFDRNEELWCEADIARRPTPQMVSDGVDLMNHYKPNIFSPEANGYQELLWGLFEDEARRRVVHVPHIHELKNTLAKVMRIRDIAPFLANRIAHFRDTPGTRLLVQQLREFPLGKHDDGPDALEMAIRGLRECSDGMWDDGGRVPQVPLEYR